MMKKRSYKVYLDRKVYDVVINRKPKPHPKYELYDFDVVAEYNPDAIVNYLKVKNSGEKVKGKSNNLNKLLDDARMHLSAIGWKFWSKIKRGKDEWRYVPPLGSKIYYSMNTACKAIVNGELSNTRDPSDKRKIVYDEEKIDKVSIRYRRKKNSGTRNRKRKKISYVSSSSSSESEYETSDEDVSVENGIELPSTPSVKKDFGNIRQKRKKIVTSSSDSEGKGQFSKPVGPSRVSLVHRTILSWLIDNKAIIPSSKVYYCKGKGTEPLAKGRISKEGILCGCCQSLFSLSCFQTHVIGNNSHRPAENIYFENEKSLVSCQVELMRKKISAFSKEKAEPTENDSVCLVCQFGGDIILCDRCPSSFHASCLGLEGVPEGTWFCSSCCCGDCGNREVDECLLCCHQCQRQYHAHCTKDRDSATPEENWFCSKTCEKMHWGLKQLIGKPILVDQKNLTFTLLKPVKYEEMDKEGCDLVGMAENYSKLDVAIQVMHECFEPVKDLQTKKDLVQDVIFCRESNIKRLNFTGFHTILLERNGELISVAILRIHGEKVAEIPLIGTRFQYRGQGMCCVLMNEVEKTLLNLGVKKLVLPAAPSILNTWSTKFGFSEVTESEKLEFLGFNLLDFRDTVICQKLLKKPPPPRLHLSRNLSHRFIEKAHVADLEEKNSMSEDFQVHQPEGNETLDEGARKNIKFYTRKNAADLKTRVAQINYVSCR